MPKTRVAILGSCVSRDPFSFLPSEDFTIEAYVARTSLVSMMAPPIPASDAFEFQPAFEKRSILDDFTKRTLRILDTDADLLVVDFIDDRFDLVEVAGSMALHTPFVKQCGILDPLGPHTIVPRTDPRVADLWSRACADFCARARARGLQDRIVLHRAKYVADYVDGDAVKPFEGWRQAFVVDHTRIIDRYHEQFVRDLGLGRVIDVEAEFCVGDAAHRWGRQPFHYGEGYYRSFLRQLRAVREAGTGS